MINIFDIVFVLSPDDKRSHPELEERLMQQLADSMQLLPPLGSGARVSSYKIRVMPTEPDIAGHPEWGTDTYCPAADGPHSPDYRHIEVAEGCRWVVDTKCVHCGRSGSASVDPRRFEF